MPNRINIAMTSEYSSKFGEAPDLVAVDYRGLTVEEMSEFRNEARAKGIEIFVVKNSIARRVLTDIADEDTRAMVNDVVVGQTAFLTGGEGMPDLAKLVNTYGKKLGKLAVRGGMFDRQMVGPKDVEKFKDIPDKPTLLAQTLATIIAPLTGVLAATNSLLSAPAALTESLQKKKEEAGES